MARVERVRQDVSAWFGPDDLRRQSEQGWKLVAVEWERELPEEAAEPSVPGEVPFGLQVAQDPPPPLEENPAEREVLFLMMELTIQDGPYSVDRRRAQSSGPSHPARIEVDACLSVSDAADA